MGVLTAIRRGASSAHRNRPFITDIGMDRRTEFTGALFEQWVAKTSNWLESEFGRELQLHMELRAHWLWPVMVAAPLVTVIDPLARPHVSNVKWVCGPALAM